MIYKIKGKEKNSLFFILFLCYNSKKGRKEKND